MNIENLTIGTISHGTLRPQDLAPAFLGLADRLEVELPEIVRADAERIAADPMPADEDADEVLLNIADMVNDELPPYLYFGTVEGDGSDYGIWYAEWCDEAVGDALLAADQAAYGDSNDTEIQALRDAVDLLQDALRAALRAGF